MNRTVDPAVAESVPQEQDPNYFDLYPPYVILSIIIIPCTKQTTSHDPFFITLNELPSMAALLCLVLYHYCVLLG